MATAPEKEKEPEKLTPEQRIDQEIISKEPEAVKRLSEIQAQLETKTYLEKVEEKEEPSQVSDQTGQVLLSAKPSTQTVTLPLTEEEIKHGLHHKIFDSIRWLAAWCVRMAKKAAVLGLKVVYRRN